MRAALLDEGHEVVGFDLLPAAIEHERYRHLIVDVREPDSFPVDLEPQVIVNVAGTQDSADDIAANLRGTINVTERYAFVGRACRQAGAGYQIRGQCGVGERAYGIGVSRLCCQQGRRYRLHQEPCKPPGAANVANSVDPGGVITPLNRCVMEDERLWSQIMELTPLKRWATAQRSPSGSTLWA